VARSTRIGIEDVARAAGVSTTTVSRAMSGSGRLAPATRQRVRELAAAMGYQPNPTARQLARGKSGVIGALVSLPAGAAGPITDVQYFDHAIHAAMERALLHDYALIVGPPTQQTEVWSRIMLDGVVVFDPVLNDPVIGRLRRAGTPLVMVGRDLAGVPGDFCVDSDYVSAIRRLLDHLHDQGATRIALLCGELGESFTADCRHGYGAWCAEHKTPPIVRTVPPTDMRSAQAAANALSDGERPDAIVVLDEVLLPSVDRLLTTRGWRVPEDVLVAAAADGEPTVGGVAVTTLQIKAAETAALAVDVLVALIAETPPPKQVQLVPTDVITRSSTDHSAR
jgi:DNA-binding LacI/PurR family transcriptional regulator